jgi:hypothetical protein
MNAETTEHTQCSAISLLADYLLTRGIKSSYVSGYFPSESICDFIRVYISDQYILSLFLSGTYDSDAVPDDKAIIARVDYQIHNQIIHGTILAHINYHDPKSFELIADAIEYGRFTPED